MTSKSGGGTINQGPAPDRGDKGKSTAKEMKDDPSPDDRRRGETSSRDRADEAGRSIAK